MEGKTIQVYFTPEETQLYDLIQQHCQGHDISVSDYIKAVVKKDFAWGHFAKRGRKNNGR